MKKLENIMIDNIYDLKTLREASHLSQKELARLVGVSVAHCRNLERAGDKRVLEAIIDSFDECEDERARLLRRAYHHLLISFLS